MESPTGDPCFGCRERAGQALWRLADSDARFPSRAPANRTIAPNASQETTFTEYFAHLTSGGSWTRTVVPATTGTTVQQASVITAVPGSASVLAAGELIVPGEGSGGIVGAVWQR